MITNILLIMILIFQAIVLFLAVYPPASLFVRNTIISFIISSELIKNLEGVNDYEKKGS